MTDSLKVRRLLLAGTLEAARLYAREHGLSSQPGHLHEAPDGNLTSWKHTMHSQQLRGLEGPNRNPETPYALIFVGAPPGYFDTEFYALARARGF